jgi:periplasmic protein TonB
LPFDPRRFCDRYWSIAVSALLHVAVIAALIVVLPDWLKPTSHSDNSKNAIAVEMVRQPPPAPAAAPQPKPEPEPQAAKAEPVLQSPKSETVTPPPAPKKVVAAPPPKTTEPPPPNPNPNARIGEEWFHATLPAEQQASLPAPGLTGPAPRYLALIRAQLEKNKMYPRIAQMRHLEGSVVVEFIIDRSGHVLRHAVSQSSGHSVLDQEADAIITRSDPLPPMPPELMGDVLRVVVPIDFNLSDSN